MSISRQHPHPAPVQWAHATWSWSSALLLSALLVSPVGADAFLHLLRLHLPSVVQTGERTPAAPVRDQTPRRSEDELPLVTHDHHAAPDADPTPALPDARILPSVRAVPPLYTDAPTPIFAPRVACLRPAVSPSAAPRAPPV